MNHSKPPNKLRSGLILANASLIFTFLMLEILVRLFLPVSDVLYGISDTERGYHREPDQRGRYVLGMGAVYGRYSINAQGWNAARDYVPQSGADLRIAVIGDSFVEAREVDVDEAFPDVMEHNLNAEGQCGTVEVYRFGIVHAPLSQYWYTMQRIAETYQPDVFIINIFTNDFDESLYPGGSGSYFWSFRREGDRFVPVPPVARQVDPRDRLLDSIALRRFLLVNLQLEERFKQWFSVPTETPVTQGRVDVSDVEPLTAYLFDEFQRIAGDAALLLTMEADRASVYAPSDEHEAKSPAYVEMVSRMADERGIDFLYLHDVLAADYALHHQRFEFTLDMHWNEYGHEVVAAALSDWVETSICK